VFQVHEVDASGAVTVRRALRRARCWRGSPSCRPAWSAWRPAPRRITGRELTRVGHHVRLIPPAYAKAYVRRNKNDAADAAAICDAVSRPAMRFVAVNSEAQQAAAGLHKLRAAGVLCASEKEVDEQAIDRVRIRPFLWYRLGPAGACSSRLSMLLPTRLASTRHGASDNDRSSLRSRARCRTSAGQNGPTCAGSRPFTK